MRAVGGGAAGGQIEEQGRAMANYGPRLVVPIDVKKKPWEQKLPLHNRWHPEIPPVDEVRCGEVFRVEMVDFSGGGITKDYSAEDIKYADPSIVSSLLICLCLGLYTATTWKGHGALSQ
ncbi:Formamidase [Vitis vinifera]|uniref:Formamidase n=1 Tax=Vitis vinifera TaxID=29760 RepID=A0A438FBS0_VITVI|nr:Formamidase [Vitis vinifera]